MTRIGLVLAEPPTYSETFLNSKIAGLKNNGFEVILFVNRNSKRKSLHSFHSSWPVFKNNILVQGMFIVVALSQLVLFSPAQAFKYFKLERKSGKSFFGIIKSMYANAHILKYKLDWLHFGFATLAIGKENVAEAIGAKLSISIRGFDICIYPLKNPGIYDHLWKKLDKVHTISDDLYNIALSHGLPDHIKFEKITPAININKFSTSAGLMKKHVPLKILTVARLHWKKGLEYGLAALHILHQKGIDFEYAIVGEGPEQERLIFEIHEYGLDEKVKLLGKLEPEKVADLLKSYDVYLQPSIQEGFCNAVLEAQSTGLLCIVSDAEGLPENVADNVSGWVIPKRDVQGMADRILNIINTPESELDIIRKNAIDRVKQHFNISDQDEKFKKFYNDY